MKDAFITLKDNAFYICDLKAVGFYPANATAKDKLVLHFSSTDVRVQFYDSEEEARASYSRITSLISPDIIDLEDKPNA